MPGGFSIFRGTSPALSGISPAHAGKEADVERERPVSDLLTRRVLYNLPGMDGVEVRRDVAYTTPADAELTMDVYSTPGRLASRGTLAVVLVSGFPGAVKRIGSFVSWAELMAASGLVVERGRPVMTRILRLPPAPGSGRRGWRDASAPGCGSPA